VAPTDAAPEGAADGEGMNRRLLLLVPLAAAAAVSLPGGAGAGNAIQLKIGDAVDVLNTRVACYALTSNGKDGIGCLLITNAGSPIAGSYSVGLAVDGTAVLNKVNADGTSTHVFKKRLPAARSTARGAVYRVKPGESFGLPVHGDVVIGCKVLNVTLTAVAPVYRGIKVSCWYATATQPVANTYGTSISDKVAGVFKITPSGSISSWGLMRQQPGS
jgi:hypothetical protein